MQLISVFPSLPPALPSLTQTPPDRCSPPQAAARAELHFGHGCVQPGHVLSAEHGMHRGHLLCEPIHDVASMFPHTILEKARDLKIEPSDLWGVHDSAK